MWFHEKGLLHSFHMIFESKKLLDDRRRFRPLHKSEIKREEELEQPRTEQKGGGLT